MRRILDWLSQLQSNAQAVNNPELAANCDRAITAVTKLNDAAEMLLVVLANVSGGDWTAKPEKWPLAAARWRDNYFEAIK